MSSESSHSGSPPKAVGVRSNSTTTCASHQSQTDITECDSSFGAGLGFDTARLPADQKDPYGRPFLTDTQLIGKRMDLPADAFKPEAGKVIAKFAKRPGFNSDGRVVKIQLNLFPVTQMPTNDIYQYGVEVSPNPKDSRFLVKKVWSSQVVQDAVREAGGSWLFDGSKLAWSTIRMPGGEIRLKVDLGAASGKTVVGRPSDIFYCTIKQSTSIKMEYLRAYINGEIEWDSTVLECMNVLDHIMRQKPSENMVAIKRNFYGHQAERTRLDSLVEVRKGTYSAFKLSEFASGSISCGLNINSDVANTAFWRPLKLSEVVQNLLSTDATGGRSHLKSHDMRDIVRMLRPVPTKDKEGRSTFAMSSHFKQLRRLVKLTFSVCHRGRADSRKEYKIKRFLFDPAYGAEGGDALHHTFQKKGADGKLGEPITVAQYFSDTYGGRLQYPDLPLIETLRHGYFPMEVATLCDFQRFTSKLDPKQTAAMIKTAVTRPSDRQRDILKGVQQLGWSDDPYLEAFGVKISPDMITTEARVLPSPDVHFAGGKFNPQVSGRWDLRGKRFIEPNQTPLASWAFVGVGANDGNAVQLDALQSFARSFVRIYKGHGGKIARDPFVAVYPYDATTNPADICIRSFQDCGNANKQCPQIMFFVVPTKNVLVYERIKKNMDCRLCLVSQVLQADHVKGNNAQYCSNVAMKVNAKLGGVTCRATPAGGNPNDYAYCSRPTMFIGLDVSHASPGGLSPSVAALTVSMDKFATKWAGACETNGWRVEIVTAANMNQMLGRLVTEWRSRNKCNPEHVYFFRDGVSEGQFSQVLELEVKEMKRIMMERLGKVTPRFTVIVATKRHHVRFFPKPGNSLAADKNGNPLPGTLVEHDATHPAHFDFYLASHVALKGTARPVHYHVLLDEAGLKPNQLQRMIYQQCYSYARSTTPVSIHPAVYYAHLTAARAKAHEDLPASLRESAMGRAGFPIAKEDTDVYSQVALTEAPKLTPMGCQGSRPELVKQINTTMWFI